MIPAVRGSRLASTLAAPRPERRKLRQGVVNAIAAGPPPTLTVTLSAGSVQITGVRYLASYAPVVNDVVWLEQNGTDLIVTGALGPGPLAAQATNLMSSIGQARLVGVVTGTPPTGGPYAVGDHALDTQGRQWLCTAAGSPGTWLPIGVGTWLCRAYLNTNVSVGTTGWSQIVGLTTDYDPSGMISGNTIVVPRAGKYRVTGRVQVNTSNIELTCRVRNGSTDVEWGTDVLSNVTGSVEDNVITCATNDSLTFWLFNSAATTLIAGTHLTYIAVQFVAA